MQTTTSQSPRDTTRVEDLMSRVVISMKPTDTVDIAKLDMDLAAIRHLPVVDAGRRLVGIVAVCDILAALARDAGPVRVDSIMKREVFTIHRKAAAHDAVRTMLDQKIGALPVLGERDELVGMLTETDFLQVAEQALRPGRPRP